MVIFLKPLISLKSIGLVVDDRVLKKLVYECAYTLVVDYIYITGPTCIILSEKTSWHSLGCKEK